jgi:hypothetical protein
MPSHPSAAHPLFTAACLLVATSALAELQRDKPGLLLHNTSEIWVKQGQVRRVQDGGFTAKWIHPLFQLDASCADRLEKVELRGAGPALARTLRPDADESSSWKQFAFDLPLWKPTDATRACAAGKKSLTASIRAELSCENDPVLKQTLSVKVPLACGRPGPDDSESDLDLLAFRGGTEEFLVGTQAVLPVEVGMLDRVIPQVVSATLVDVDARKKVRQRFVTLPVSAGAEEVKADLTLDTSTPRTFRLAAEVTYADGTTRLSDVREVNIITQAFVEARLKEQETGSQRLHAFDQRFEARFPDPCADVAATVAWLKAQPEIESAHGNGHHNFDYRVKGSGITLIGGCHDPEAPDHSMRSE